MLLSRSEPAYPLEVKGFEPDRTVQYKRVGETDLTLDVFLPPGHKSSDRRPAIVFFFGGGWNGGSPSQFYPHCQYLASRGMVAMSAEYRVKSRHETTPRECVKDGKSALRWIRRHAAELGIDPDKVAAGGGSAGGHVAAATATTKGFNEAGEDLSVSCRPNVLVLFNPVYLNGPTVYEIPVNDHQLDAIERQLTALCTAIERAIENDRFPTRPGPLCDYCAYQHLSPALAPEV